jgi:hypothetical protein
MPGEVGILNVGAGDIKLSFDKNNPAECIRAARIVKDMLRRGYAILVAVEQPNGTTAYQRIKEFREDTFEYIIADLDPEIAAAADAQEAGEGIDASDEPAATAAAPARRKKGRQAGPGRRALSAHDTKAVAVPHRAGG